MKFIMSSYDCVLPPPRLIRMSSPNLNYLIGGGAIILYMDIYFFIIPTTDQQALIVLCNATPWLTAVGYSLCYGTILAKMVRVYFIFDNPRHQQKKVEMHISFCFVLVLPSGSNCTPNEKWKENGKLNPWVQFGQSCRHYKGAIYRSHSNEVGIYKLYNQCGHADRTLCTSNFIKSAIMYRMLSSATSQ